MEVGRNAEQASHKRKCNYAVLHDVQCMNGVGTLEKAPGDGACLWHACALAGADEGTWSPSASFALKADILDFVRSQPAEVASLLNASCVAADAILHDWSPQDAWADGRAPPLIAAHTGATVMIVNMAEQCIEIFTCAHSLAGIDKLWVLCYDHEHFDCIRVQDHVRVRQILQACTLEPLLVNEPSLKPTLKGGASGDPRLATPTVQQHGVAMQTWLGVPYHEQTDYHGMCHSYNVGGLMSHAHTITGSLSSTMQIVAVQETLVTANNQRMLSKDAQQTGWEVYWGPPAPYKRNARGAWRIDRDVPGVAFWHTKDVGLFPADFRTPAAKAWYHRGRLLLACVPGKDRPVYLLNVYAPAGVRKRKEYHRFMNDLTEELAQWHTEQILVLGDFQTHLSESPYYLRMAVQGWRAPHMLDRQGNLHPPTYRSGKITSVIDCIICSPDYDSQIQHVLVTPQLTTPHAILSVPFALDRCEPHPQVCYPPKLHKGPVLGVYDWKATTEQLDCVCDQLLASTAQWTCQQELIDGMWGEFELAMREHLRMTGIETHDSSGNDTQQLNRCGDASPHWRTRVKHVHKSQSARVVHQAIAWLVSCANQEGGAKPQQKLDMHRSVIMDSLGLSETQYNDAIARPGDHIQDWKKRLARFKVRDRQRHIRAWRSKLFTHRARPTPVLYRWIRSLPRQTNMIVKNEQHISMGPTQCFASLRAYWESVMCYDLGGRRDAMCWASHERTRAPEIQHNPEQLVYVCKSMNKEAAPGLDCWPAECLRFVTLPVARALVLIFRAIELTGVWPRSWCLVRTHLVPKTDEPIPTASQYRPLSIMSIWYRLWGSYHLRMISPDLYSRFAPGLRGGIPQRGLADMIATPALRLEASLNHLQDDSGARVELHWANIDAVKCFDRLSMVRAAQAATTFGLPLRLVTTLVSFWVSLTRHLSMTSYIDPVAIHPLNGVPQGCAASALVCNCLIQQWHDAVAPTQCVPSAFIDDRYLSAACHEHLAAGWRESVAWEEMQGWHVNVDKSAHIQCPCTHDVLERGEQKMPKPIHFTSLGVDIATRTSVPLERQRQRCETAVGSAQRIERLRLPTHTAQILLETIVMPQAIHHLQVRPLSRACETKIRMATQRAANLYRRAHCVPIVNALIRKPHRADPASHAMYVHVTTLAGALRQGGEAMRWWQLLRTQPLRAAPRGPRATMCIYMQRHQLTESEDGATLHHPRAGECDWIRVSPRALGHYLRVVLRDSLLLIAQKRRPELEGVCDIDVHTTMQYYRQQSNPYRAEISAIVCDGLWPLAKKKQAGLVQDATCRACGEGIETIAHVWWECRAWAHLRHLSPAIVRLWQDLPRYAWKCLICPSTAAPAITKAWPQIQQQCSIVWRERTRMGVRQGWVLNETSKQAVKQKAAPTMNGAPDATQADPRNDMLIAGEELCGRSREYPLKLTYSLSPPRNPWIYSRQQWHRLTHFASRLRLPSQNDTRHTVRPSVLELYLSYIHANGGVRFESGIPDDKDGGRIAVQMAAFVNAWRSMQGLCQAPDLLPDAMLVRTRRAEQTEWGYELGLPRFALLRMHVLLPHWTRLGKWLCEGRDQIYGQGGQGLTRDMEPWRRWTPGLPQSQQQAAGGHLANWPLAACPHAHPKRLRVKTSVPVWRIQAACFQKWRAQWLVPLPLHTRYRILDNKTVIEWIDAQGLLTRDDLVSMVGRWGCVARHAQRLIEHNRVAPLRGWHQCNTVMALRWKCVTCLLTGHLVPRFAWLEQPCSHKAFACSSDLLTLEQSEARTVQAHISAFLKKC